MINYQDCFVPEYTCSTLCEICANACGHCDWSKKNVQKPVEGWDAIRNDIMPHGKGSGLIESYVVLDCPEYQPDEYAERFPFNREEAIRRVKIRKDYSCRVAR